MSTASPEPVDVQLPADARVAVVAARFNGHITDELLAGCVRRLDELGLTREHVEVHRVPGAFELPVAARVLAQTKRFSAVICLGCVVRGDTPHFDFVAGECAQRDPAGGDHRMPAGNLRRADDEHRAAGARPGGRFS